MQETGKCDFGINRRARRLKGVCSCDSRFAQSFQPYCFAVHTSASLRFRKPRSVKKSAATVAGRVTIKGQPAAGIVVGLRSSESAQFGPTLKATTDQDGKYRIAEVPQGKYEIAPVAPAFVISDVNNSRGQGVIINEGEKSKGSTLI